MAGGTAPASLVVGELGVTQSISLELGLCLYFIDLISLCHTWHDNFLGHLQLWTLTVNIRPDRAGSHRKPSNVIPDRSVFLQTGSKSGRGICSSRPLTHMRLTPRTPQKISPAHMSPPARSGCSEFITSTMTTSSSALWEGLSSEQKNEQEHGSKQQQQQEEGMKLLPSGRAQCIKERKSREASITFVEQYTSRSTINVSFSCHYHH